MKYIHAATVVCSIFLGVYQLYDGDIVGAIACLALFFYADAAFQTHLSTNNQNLRSNPLWPFL